MEEIGRNPRTQRIDAVNNDDTSINQDSNRIAFHKWQVVSKTHNSSVTTGTLTFKK